MSPNCVSWSEPVAEILSDGDGPVRIAGLGDLRRALKKLNLTDDLKDANSRVAQMVVDEAGKRARAIGAMQAKAAESLTANRAQSKATVSIGGSRYAFALGAEFGSVQFPQFEQWRGQEGYWLWPAIRGLHDQIVGAYGDELTKLTAEAFPD